MEAATHDSLKAYIKAMSQTQAAKYESLRAEVREREARISAVERELAHSQARAYILVIASPSSEAEEDLINVLREQEEMTKALYGGEYAPSVSVLSFVSIDAARAFANGKEKQILAVHLICHGSGARGGIVWLGLDDHEHRARDLFEKFPCRCFIVNACQSSGFAKKLAAFSLDGRTAVTAFGWKKIVEDEQCNLATQHIYQEVAAAACQPGVTILSLDFKSILARALGRLKDTTAVNATPVCF